MANFLRPETVSPPGKKELPNIQEDEEKNMRLMKLLKIRKLKKLRYIKLFIMHASAESEETIW